MSIQTTVHCLFKYSGRIWRRTALVILASAVAGLSLSVSASQIGLKLGMNGLGGFQGTNAGALLPSDLAGAPGYQQTNWNVLGRFGSSINPTNSDGVLTAISVNWDCTGNWSQAGGGTPTAQGTPDGNLMNAYIDSNGNGNNTLGNPVDGFNSTNNNSKPWVYFTGLSAWMVSESVASYDIVVYSDGDATSGRGGEYWLQNATGPWSGSGMTLGSDLTTHATICDRANFVSTLTYAQVPATVYGSTLALSGQTAQRGNFQGNYAVFTSITNDSFLLRTAEFATRSPINAIQIIPRSIPSPAMIDPLPVAPKVVAGGTARLRAQVAGVLPMTFRWLKNGSELSDGGNISGATTTTLNIASISGGDVASYSLVVTNPNGVVTSSVSGLTLETPVGNSYAEKIITNSPFAYWRFSDAESTAGNYATAYDSIGGFNGIYGNAVVNAVAGPQPTDFSGFESTNTAMQSARNLARSWVVAPPLGMNTNTATLCAWIYPTAAQTASTTILGARNTGSDVVALGYINNANNMIGYTWNNANFGFASGLIPLTNAWSFIALVVTPTNAILYCYNAAGQFSATNTVAHPVVAFGGITTIGTDPSSATTPQDRAFSGSIDEVAVFNRSLLPGEIYDLYKKGVGLAVIPPVIATQPKPLGLYEGRTARFSVVASGELPLSYQWRRNGVNLSNGGNTAGALSSALTLSSVTIGGESGDYDVVVSNAANSITSSVANLLIVVSNSNLKPYEAKLRELNPIAYWRMNETNGNPNCYDYWGGNIAANANVTLEVPGPVPPDFTGMESTNTAGQYDGLSSATATTESIMNNRAQFSIIGWFNKAGQIGNRVGLFGQNDVCEFGFHDNGADGQARIGIFTARGSAFLLQSNTIPNNWYLVAAIGDGSNVSLRLISTNGAGGFQVLQANTAHAATTNYGSSFDPFRIGGAGILDTTGNFFTGFIDEVAVFDRALSVGELSDLFGAALLGGALPPGIANVSGSLNLYAGRTATFQVSAVGTTPQYRWRTNGVPISNGGNVSGATTDTLVITNVSAFNQASYDVVVTNGVGSVTSTPPATLTVITPTPGSYEAAIIAANPIAYYRLNSTNDPSSGTDVTWDYFGGHNGVYGSGSQNGFNLIQGPIPPQFSFETNNWAVSVSSNVPSSHATAPIGSLSTNTVTITMWIQPTTMLQDAFAGLLVNRNAGVAGGFNYCGGNLGYTWNNNNAATYNATYGNVSGRSDLIPPTNEWSFVALVVEPTQATVYMINPHGMRSATNILAHTSDVFGNNWRIGNDDLNNNNNSARSFAGYIDEVAVFGYSMTGQQLLNLYNVAGPPFVNLSIQRLGNDVVVTWPQGTLLQADAVTGPWVTNNVTSPYTNSSSPQKFYRVQVR